MLIPTFTLSIYSLLSSRSNGEFDFYVNGGGSIQLQFQRQPFIPQEVTAYAPWNRYVVLAEPIRMPIEGTVEPIRMPIEGTVEQLKVRLNLFVSNKITPILLLLS